MNKRSVALLAVLLGSLISAPAWAKQKKAPPAPPVVDVRKPIVCKWTTMEGMKYYYSGAKIEDRRSLGEIVSTLHDPEVDRLWRVTTSSEDVGVIFSISGGALFLGGLGIAMSSPNFTSNSTTLDGTETAGLIVTLGGLVAGYVGIFKLEESNTSKFAAIQRYNAVIHGDDTLSLNSSRPGIRMDLVTLKF